MSQPVRRRIRRARVATRPASSPAVRARVLSFIRRRPRAVVGDRVADAALRCPKCRSTFVSLEPAFVHCHYCGAMTRIPGASLEAQELFEIRSGLRIAV